MIFPSLSDLMKKTDSRYSLVIATAKRARMLSEEDPEGCEKPVSTAIDEIYNGEVIITESKKPEETPVPVPPEQAGTVGIAADTPSAEDASLDTAAAEEQSADNTPDVDQA